MNRHLRSAQVWHMFSRDLTVLPAQPHVQSTIGMSHIYLCLPSYSWYSFTDPRRKAEMAWVAGYIVRVFLSEGKSPIPLLTGLNVAQLHWSRPMRYRRFSFQYLPSDWLEILLWIVSPFFFVALGSWVISLTVFGASVTNLNEPPRALATSTITWVRS